MFIIHNLQRVGGRLGIGPLYGDAVRLLRYGRGVDNRRLRDELGFEPRFDAVGAIRDLAAHTASLRLAPVPGLGNAISRLVGDPR